jgi:hypothetical protein
MSGLSPAYEHRENSLVVEFYDSTGQFLDIINERRRNDHIHSSEEQGGFYGEATHSVPELFLHARYGEPLYAGRVNKLMAKLTDTVERSSAEGFAWDVYGDSFDVPRILEGEPECWMRFKEVPGRGCRILVNGSNSGGVSPDFIARRGTAVATLCRLLQGAGVAVSVDVAYPACAFHQTMNVPADNPVFAESLEKARRTPARDGHENAGIFMHAIRIQQQDSPLDPDAFAFWLVNPSALRRAHFLWLERLGAPGSDLRDTFDTHWGTGYGYPSQLTGWLAAGLDLGTGIPREGYDMILENSQGDPRCPIKTPFENDEKTAAWVVHQVKSLSARVCGISEQEV